MTVSVLIALLLAYGAALAWISAGEADFTQPADAVHDAFTARRDAYHMAQPSGKETA